jgi:hypothetical protein
MGNIYHTFRDDISDPLNSVFRPLIQISQNENTEVKLAVLNTLISCGVRDDEVTCGVIHMLADNNQMLR